MRIQSSLNVDSVYSLAPLKIYVIIFAIKYMKSHIYYVLNAELYILKLEQWVDLDFQVDLLRFYDLGITLGNVPMK